MCAAPYIQTRPYTAAVSAGGFVACLPFICQQRTEPV